MITVAVVASNTLARARLEALVASQPGLRLVTTGVEADVVLIEAGQRPADAVLRAVTPASSRPRVVLLAGDLTTVASLRLLRAGAHAILPREPSGPEIAAAMEAVAAGLVVLHPSVTPGAGANAKSARQRAEPGGRDPLTPRELEILGMMAEGMGNRMIGRRLGISTHTVKFHVAAILDKLNARSRTQAVTTGLRQGLLMV